MANSLEKRIQKIERTCPKCGGELTCLQCHPREVVFRVVYPDDDPPDVENKDHGGAHADAE